MSVVVNPKDTVARTLAEKPGTPGTRDLVLRFQIDKTNDQSLVEETMSITDAATAFVSVAPQAVPETESITDVANSFVIVPLATVPETESITDVANSFLEVPIIAVPETESITDVANSILEVPISVVPETESLTDVASEFLTSANQTPGETEAIIDIATPILGLDIIEVVPETEALGRRAVKHRAHQHSLGSRSLTRCLNVDVVACIRAEGVIKRRSCVP